MSPAARALLASVLGGRANGGSVDGDAGDAFRSPASVLSPLSVVQGMRIAELQAVAAPVTHRIDAKLSGGSSRRQF
jgi:hypothetical protein